MMTAMVCAGAVTAQFVGGKATRDALFLASLDYTALPTMLIATSVFSILLVGVNSRAARSISPATLVPASFVASGVLFLLEWLLTYRRRSPAAVIVYLHISGVGPLLASGFWLISSERFDPRTAKTALRPDRGGRDAGRSAERAARRAGRGHRSASPRCCPSSPRFHFLSAWQVRRLAVESRAITGRTMAAETFRNPTAAPSRSGLRVIAEAPYLRYLAALVAARHDERRAGRLSLQGAGGRDLRPRRQPAPLLRRSTTPRRA